MLIADQGQQKILAIDFSNKTNEMGAKVSLYDGPQDVNLEFIQGIAADSTHNLLYWGNSNNGTTLGSLV